MAEPGCAAPPVALPLFVFSGTETRRVDRSCVFTTKTLHLRPLMCARHRFTNRRHKGGVKHAEGVSAAALHSHRVHGPCTHLRVSYQTGVLCSYPFVVRGICGSTVLPQGARSLHSPSWPCRLPWCAFDVKLRLPTEPPPGTLATKGYVLTKHRYSLGLIYRSVVAACQAGIAGRQSTFETKQNCYYWNTVAATLVVLLLMRPGSLWLGLKRSGQLQ